MRRVPRDGTQQDVGHERVQFERYVGVGPRRALIGRPGEVVDRCWLQLRDAAVDRPCIAEIDGAPGGGGTPGRYQPSTGPSRRNSDSR